MTIIVLYCIIRLYITHVVKCTERIVTSSKIAQSNKSTQRDAFTLPTAVPPTPSPQQTLSTPAPPSTSFKPVKAHRVCGAGRCLKIY